MLLTVLTILTDIITICVALPVLCSCVRTVQLFRDISKEIRGDGKEGDEKEDACRRAVWRNFALLPLSVLSTAMGICAGLSLVRTYPFLCDLKAAIHDKNEFQVMTACLSNFLLLLLDIFVLPATAIVFVTGYRVPNYLVHFKKARESGGVDEDRGCCDVHGEGTGGGYGMRGDGVGVGDIGEVSNVAWFWFLASPGAFSGTSFGLDQ